MRSLGISSLKRTWRLKRGVWEEEDQDLVICTRAETGCWAEFTGGRGETYWKRVGSSKNLGDAWRLISRD